MMAWVSGSPSGCGFVGIGVCANVGIAPSSDGGSLLSPCHVDLPSLPWHSMLHHPPVVQVSEALGLPDIRSRQWSIQEASALKGKGLFEGFDW